MNIKFKKLAILLAIAYIVPSSIAIASNAYNIEYEGGAPLGADNVHIDPTLVNSLTTLMQMDDVTVRSSASNLWKNGFVKDKGDDGTSICLPFRYFSVPRTNLVASGDELGVTISKNQYKAEVIFNKITLEMSAEDTSDSLYTVGYTPNHSFIYGGFEVFSDNSCEQPAAGLRKLMYNDDNRMFIEMKIKLYKNNQDSAFVTDGLYFGITDIDAAQSYKILNTDNKLSPTNMYAKSAEDLQPDESMNLKNMFVSNGNYIYSQYDKNASPAFFDTLNTANIYLNLERDTQQNGLDLVFGFAHAAASGVEYYAKQLNVTYKSDENGRITGIRQEKVITGDNPSGSKSTPNEGYEFEHWVADKDVVLEDGTEIKAGDHMTSEQVKQVVVTEDLEFTAIHEGIQLKVTYESDKNGKITGIEEEEVTSGNHPSGSESKPNDGYGFRYWIADKDVVLEDGTEIKAGGHMTSEQVKQVVVTEDLEFTAIHVASKKPNTPYTGASTGEINAIQISVSIICILAFVALAYVASRLAHKKVNFN